MRQINCWIVAGLAVVAACAQAQDVAKFDPRMAMEKAEIDTNGVKWIDGRYLPLEGKYFQDVDRFYDRLPSGVTTNVNGGVRSMKCHTSGMMFRFRTDSKHLTFRWIPISPNLAMGHMPATGVSGIDVYCQDAKGRWRYVKTGRISDAVKGGTLTMGWTPGSACLVNLPLTTASSPSRSASTRMPRWRLSVRARAASTSRLCSTAHRSPTVAARPVRAWAS